MPVSVAPTTASAPPAPLETDGAAYSIANGPGSGPGIKIVIRQDGWYRIGCAAMAPAFSAGGLDILTLRLSTLRLLLVSPAEAQNVTEVALRRVDNDGADRCDAGDGVKFWGAARPNRYSDLTVYWLVGGKSPGPAVTTKQSTTGGVPLALAQCTVTLEADNLYRSSTPAARTYALTLPAPAPVPFAGGAATGAQAFVTFTPAGLDGHLKTALCLSTSAGTAPLLPGEGSLSPRAQRPLVTAPSTRHCRMAQVPAQSSAEKCGSKQ